jgi:hypothetical protein
MLKSILNVNRTSETNQSIPCVSMLCLSFNGNEQLLTETVQLQTQNLMQMLNITSYSEEPIYSMHHLISEKEKKLNTTNPKYSHLSISTLIDPVLCNTLLNINMSEISRYQDAQNRNLQTVKSAMDQIYSELHWSDIAIEKSIAANIKKSIKSKITKASSLSSEINKSIVEQKHMQHTPTSRNQQELRYSPLKIQNFLKLNAFTTIKKGKVKLRNYLKY